MLDAVPLTRAFTAVLAACVLSLALVAAGCGDDDDASSETETSAETSAAEWADGVCTALTTWTGDLDAAAEPLGDVSSLSGDSIRQAAEDVKIATETLTESLRDLGRPDTESGEQVESSVEDIATELEDGAEALEAAVADVSGIADIPGAVGTITTTLTELGDDVQSLVQNLEDADVSGELETAFEDAESCGELTD
jgi:hypothetical protein